MDFKEFYREFHSRFAQDLAGMSLPASYRYVYDPIEYILENKGKQLRPAILAAVAFSFSGASYEEVLPAARSVEMTHNFTLVHDDIMDQDDLRHGRETVHKKFDDATAILSGDGLFALALKQLSEYASDPVLYTQLMTVLVEAVLKVCEGQADDISFESSENISLEDYLRMISRKTSWLLAVSARMGAVLGKASLEEQNIVEDVVLKLGVVFQIQDDMLELTSDSEKMGKSLGSDLIREKKTYPYLCAEEMLSPELWKRFRELIQEDVILNEGIKPACELLAKNGIFTRCEDVISDYKQEMDTMIATLPETVQQTMKSLIQLILDRKN